MEYFNNLFNIFYNTNPNHPQPVFPYLSTICLRRYIYRINFNNRGFTLICEAWLLDVLQLFAQLDDGRRQQISA